MDAEKRGEYYDMLDQDLLTDSKIVSELLLELERLDKELKSYQSTLEAYQSAFKRFSNQGNRYNKRIKLLKEAILNYCYKFREDPDHFCIATSLKNLEESVEYDEFLKKKRK